MTDDERREAERYANKFVACPREELEPWQEEIASHWLAGRESVRGRTKYGQTCFQMEMEIKAERARSAKLIERLQAVRSTDSWSKVWQIIETAIAEYKGS